MTSWARPAPVEWPLLSFLRAELAPWEGRIGAVIRIGVCCTAVVIVAMVFRIPEPAYAAYLVFLTSQRERTSTLISGVVAAVCATFALGLTLVLYALDAGEPALRIPLMAGITFLGMYLSRVMVAGPAAFLAGFLMVVTQTIIDGFPSLELLVRLVLWLWVVIMLPVAVTILVNLLLGQDPARLARKTALGLLQDLERALRDGASAGISAGHSKVQGLAKLRHLAGILDHGLRESSATDEALIETLGELLALAGALPDSTPKIVRDSLAAACGACKAGLETGVAPDIGELLPPPRALQFLRRDELPVVVAVASAMRRLADGLSHRHQAPDAPRAEQIKHLLVADAFTNPDYAFFALKTTIAAMAAYVIYNAVDWQGIRTAVITCFFVALATVGETVHKLVLRLSGAVIGGLAGGLCIVFVLPWMTDIGQLSLLIFAVSVTCAWVSTSSERLAYAGMQMAFAFFLGVMQGFGPSDDLTVLRDRVAGILLGNVLMTLVFSVAWPVSARGQARRALADTAAALAALLREGRFPHGKRLGVLAGLEKARQMTSISVFEQPLLSAGSHGRTPEEELLYALEGVGAMVLAVSEQGADADEVRLHQADQVLAGRLDACAQSISHGAAAAAAPAVVSELPDLASPIDAAPEVRSPIEARQLLAISVEQVHAYAA